MVHHPEREQNDLVITLTERGPTMLQKGDLLQPNRALPIHRLLWHGKERFCVSVKAMTSISSYQKVRHTINKQSWLHGSSSRTRTK